MMDGCYLLLKIPRRHLNQKLVGFYFLYYLWAIYSNQNMMCNLYEPICQYLLLFTACFVFFKIKYKIKHKVFYLVSVTKVLFITYGLHFI